MKATPDLKSTPDKKPPSAKHKNAKAAKKKRKLDEKFAEEKRLSAKITEKFTKHKKKEDDAAVLKIKTKGDKQKVSVENSPAHNNVVLQAEERHVGKQYQLELRNDAICSQFKCAACTRRSNVGDLGDLFGPYYLHINDPEHWPGYLAKKPPKITKKEEYVIDVWLHGDCALHLPRVFLQGGELKNLEEVINQSWKNKCSVCHELGASFIAGPGILHYPCAKEKGYI